MRSVMLMAAASVVLAVAFGTAAAADPLDVRFEFYHSLRSLEDIGGGLAIQVHEITPERAVWFDLGGLYQNETDSMNLLLGLSTEVDFAETVTFGLANKAGLGYVPARSELRLFLAHAF